MSPELELWAHAYGAGRERRWGRGSTWDVRSAGVAGEEDPAFCACTATSLACCARPGDV